MKYLFNFVALKFHIMYYELRNYFIKFNKITLFEFKLIEDLIEIEYIPKDTIIIRPGMSCHKIRFLHLGAVESYIINHRNHKIILEQHSKNEFVSDVTSFYSNRPSSIYIKVIEDAHVFAFSKSSIKELSTLNTNLRILFDKLIYFQLLKFENKLIQAILK